MSLHFKIPKYVCMHVHKLRVFCNVKWTQNIDPFYHHKRGMLCDSKVLHFSCIAWLPQTFLSIHFITGKTVDALLESKNFSDSMQVRVPFRKPFLQGTFLVYSILCAGK